MSTLSVVLMNYNHAPFLRTAIDSVLAQSRQPDEFLLLDDCSTDDSAAIMSLYAAKHDHARFLRNERNQGVLANIDRLLAEANGDYFFSLAADDCLKPGYFAAAMALLEQHPQAAFCTSLSMLIDEKGRDLGLAPVPIVAAKDTCLSPTDVRSRLLRYGAWFMGNTAIYRRSALEEAGGFRPELRSFSDGFLCHLLALQHGCCYIPKPYGAWRRMPGGYSVSTNRDLAASREAVRHTVELMLGEYRDLFPRRYVRQWQRRQNYWMGEARLLKPLRAQAAGVGELGKELTHNWPSMAFRPMVRFGYWLLGRLVQLYLVLLSFTWPATPLMIRWWWANRRYRRGNAT